MAKPGRHSVGGQGVESIRMQVRLPLWMATFIREQAVKQEMTPSAIVRLALRRAFFSDSADTNLHGNGSMLHEDVEAKS